MDGCLRAEDFLNGIGERSFRVIGSAFAGRSFSGVVGAGQAVRIMTGGVMPAGADSVVMQEKVRTDGEHVLISAGVQHGQNVRRAGEDLSEGSVAIPRGKRIGPADLGLVASLGLAELCVARRLRVASSPPATNSPASAAPGPGQVYDSNRYTLHGVLTRLGCDLRDMGVIPDCPEAIEAAFRSAAASSDVILSSGGVSVGDADFIRTDGQARRGASGRSTSSPAGPWPSAVSATPGCSACPATRWRDGDLLPVRDGRC
jgi:molybdopterin molybdotransferase